MGRTRDRIDDKHVVALVKALGEDAPGLQVDAVACLQSADQVRVGLLAVSLRNFLHGLRLGACEGAHFLEEVLEASWADELDNNHRVVSGIPQSMHDAARLEEEAALIDLYLVLADQAADPPPVNECVLVFVLMAVRYHEFTWDQHGRLRGKAPRPYRRP